MGAKLKIKIDLKNFNWSHLASVAMTLVVVVNVLFILYLFWFRLNFVQMDIAGHLASAKWIAKGYYHLFNDHLFLGSIHDLFYPPLEDFILGFFDILGAKHEILVYRIYLSLVLLGYVASALLLSLNFKKKTSLSFFLLTFFFLLNVDKPELLEYQGLSYVDLWHTGMTAETLGAIFFFLLVNELLRKGRTLWICAFATLALLSHIIIGAVVCLILICYGALTTRKKILENLNGPIGAFLLALGISAFFWVPLVAYRNYVVSSNMFRLNPLGFFSISICALIFAFESRRSRPFFLTASLLLLPMVIGPWINSHGLAFPPFHYYRFGIISLFLIAIGFSLAFDEPLKSGGKSENWRRSFLFAASGAFVALILQHFDLQHYKFDFHILRPTEVNLSGGEGLTLNDYGRFWVTGEHRASDFGEASLMSLEIPDFNTSTGSFWESHRNNLLYSSYLATLLAPPMVLDYYYHYGYSCEALECLLDHFFRDYNVKGWIADPRFPLDGLTPQRRACYQSILNKGGTTRFELLKKNRISFSQDQFDVYWVKPRDGSPISNDAIDPISYQELRPFDPKVSGFYAGTIRAVMDSCKKVDGNSKLTFMTTQGYEKLNSKVSAFDVQSPLIQSLKTEMKKIEIGKFEINIDSKVPIFFRIKLAYFPGAELLSDQGVSLPLYEGMAGMIGYGHSKMTLIFRRTWSMWLGYGISIFSLVFFLVLAFRGRKHGRSH